MKYIQLKSGIVFEFDHRVSKQQTLSNGIQWHIAVANFAVALGAHWTACSNVQFMAEEISAWWDNYDREESAHEELLNSIHYHENMAVDNELFAHKDQELMAFAYPDSEHAYNKRIMRKDDWLLALIHQEGRSFISLIKSI